MRSMRNRTVAVLMFSGLLLGEATPRAAAQFNLRTIPSAQQRFPVNPYFLVAPGMTQAQYLNNVRAYARTAQQIPPWAYGYNPYPNPIINTGTVVNPYAANLPYGNPYGVAAPFGVNPYSPVAPTYPGTGAGSNPYSPVGPTDPYAGVSPYGGYGWNPYTPYVNSYASTLFGAADVMRSLSQVATSQEQARLMREQAMQARLETRKKQFDLEMYIKANTPTFTEEQAKVASMTLRRIQNDSNPAEIMSGKALNILLDDLRKYPGKKVSMEPIKLSEEVLKGLNVTSSFGSLGLLREEGRVEFPPALATMIPDVTRNDLQTQIQALVKGAMGGKVDDNVLKDVRAQMDNLRDQLAKKINDIPTSDYLQAKRFLNDFDEARVGLERGEAKNQMAYWQFVASGPKTVQEVAEFFVRTGLKVAPAAQNDEASYRAFYSALAAYDVAMNAHLFGSTAKSSEE